MFASPSGPHARRLVKAGLGHMSLSLKACQVYISGGAARQSPDAEGAGLVPGSSEVEAGVALNGAVVQGLPKLGKEGGEGGGLPAAAGAVEAGAVAAAVGVGEASEVGREGVPLEEEEEEDGTALEGDAANGLDAAVAAVKAEHELRERRDALWKRWVVPFCTTLE